jgi:hypothetical protein
MARPAFARRRFPHLAPIPEHLFVRLDEPWPKAGRPIKHDVSTWRVSDDWPEQVPVTRQEVEVFEAWFGDLFDELFGPR